MKKSVLLIALIITISVSSNKAESQDFDKEEFAQRRLQFMEKMNSGVAIFTSAKVANRSNDVDYQYRQDSDFYYLTGFEEPESAFLLMPGAKDEFIMFVRQRNPAAETWTGKRVGVHGAMHTFGADTAFTIDKFEEMLPRFLRRKEKVYYSMNDEAVTGKLMNVFKQTWMIPPELINPLYLIHEQRLFKSPKEIELLRKAINITCEAHREAMKAAEPGMYEYELEAIIEYIYRRNGSEYPGFPSIVGSGPNSTILHYETNNRKTRNGEVIVMDIGAEYGYYTADVTRTIPVNGRFSKEQREIYQIVYDAQQAGIDMVAPGVGLREISGKIAEIVKDGLLRLGLITDTGSRWQYRIWYMHGPSHWLGIDVHDVGDSGFMNPKGRSLEPGMVFTVEPGIYINESSLDNLSLMAGRMRASEEEIASFIEKVKPEFGKYVNIGVRIEDDVLVTETGYELLSAKAPRSIEDIEKLMKESSYVNK